MKDLVDALGTAVCVLPAQTVTGAVATNAPADLLGYDGALIVVNAGTISGTNDATLVILDGTTGGTLAASYGTTAATDLLGGGTLAALAAAASNTVIVRQYVGTKRYLRVSASAGTGAGAPVSAVIIPCNGRHL